MTNLTGNLLADSTPPPPEYECQADSTPPPPEYECQTCHHHGSAHDWLPSQEDCWAAAPCRVSGCKCGDYLDPDS